MLEKKRDTRGGARPGAGRKRRRFCVELDADMVDRLTQQREDLHAYMLEHAPDDPAYAELTSLEDYFVATVQHLLRTGNFGEE